MLSEEYTRQRHLWHQYLEYKQEIVKSQREYLEGREIISSRTKSGKNTLYVRALKMVCIFDLSIPCDVNSLSRVIKKQKHRMCSWINELNVARRMFPVEKLNFVQAEKLSIGTHEGHIEDSHLL